MTISATLFDRRGFQSDRFARPRAAAHLRTLPPVRKPSLTPELMEFHKQEAHRLRAEAMQRAMRRVGCGIAWLWTGIFRMLGFRAMS